MRPNGSMAAIRSTHSASTIHRAIGASMSFAILLPEATIRVMTIVASSDNATPVA